MQHLRRFGGLIDCVQRTGAPVWWRGGESLIWPNLKLCRADKYHAERRHHIPKHETSMVDARSL